MSIPIFALDPRYSIYIGGFDRRGASASLNNVTSSSMAVTGYFSDLADFVTLYLFDSDDRFGHLYTTKYLPIFDLTGTIVEFDLETVNCYWPGSYKFQSVPWGKLQWVLADGTSGSSSVVLSGATGGSAATVTLTLGGIATDADRVQIIYLGNVVLEYYLDNLDTINTVINSLVANVRGSIGLVKQINNLNTFDPVQYPFTATGTPTTIIITSTSDSIDGNSIQFLTRVMGVMTILPVDAKMIGGVDPTSTHVTLDLATINPFFSIEQLRQCWLTIAPLQPYDSSASAQTMQPYVSQEFEYNITNWTVTNQPTLKIASTNSVVVDSQNVWALAEGTWALENGFYVRGFAKASSTIGDTITISYSCQVTHDLYLGTSLYTDRGIFEVDLDSSPLPDLNCYLNVASQLNTRREIALGVAAGDHTLTLTVKTGSVVYFDYLHCVEEVDPSAALITYPQVSSALDFDTDQTYKVPPFRNFHYFNCLGFTGDVDLYGGVFFALKRRRRGGFFHSAVLTVAGTLNTGTGFGDGDAFFIDVSGTSLGVAAFPADTLDTIAQRFVNAINATFVGIWAARTGTGELTITCLSPINGFTFSISSSTAGATWTKTGDIDAGNEGIWEVDDTQPLPLNRGFVDYLSDFATLSVSLGYTYTLAFSQELLAPPDLNTVAGAWIERFRDDSAVLTSTVFGTWGSGFITEIVAGVIAQKGHGYIPGYIISDGFNFFTIASVPDVDHYTVVSGTPAIGFVVAELQTSQCNFSSHTFVPYISLVFSQAAQIADAAGVMKPWLQFGEMGWWFFANSEPSMAYYDAYTQDAANTALGRALFSFSDPNEDPSVNSFQDVDFLQGQVFYQLGAIRATVLALVPTAKFSWLYPSDVNWYTAFQNMFAFPIGGQLNQYVNTPIAYLAPGSDVDRVDGEALAWGTSYRTMDNSIVSMSIPGQSPWSWDLTLQKYFIPWQNAGCPFEEEWLQSQRVGLNVVFWAFDHIILFSWIWPLRQELIGLE